MPTQRRPKLDVGTFPIPCSVRKHRHIAALTSGYCVTHLKVSYADAVWEGRGRGAGRGRAGAGAGRPLTSGDDLGGVGAESRLAGDGVDHSAAERVVPVGLG